MSAEKKMYDEVDQAFDGMVEESEQRKISGVGLIAVEEVTDEKEASEIIKMQSDALKNKVAELVYRKSSSEMKQLSILSATVAELTFEAVSGSPNEEIFYQKFKAVMEKKSGGKPKDNESIEDQLEKWLRSQPLPMKNSNGEMEMWNFQACMLNNSFIRPTITLSRPDRGNMLTVGLYEIMKNLGEANLDWDS